LPKTSKVLARLRSRSPTRSRHAEFLQVPQNDDPQRSMSLGGFDETMATCSENITRASSRINVRDVDIEMVQIVLKAQDDQKSMPATIIVTTDHPTETLEIQQTCGEEESDQIEDKV
jgi:hypothetical protein